MQHWTIYGEPKHDRPLVSISAAALHRDPGQAGEGHGQGGQGGAGYGQGGQGGAGHGQG